jgi:hypothetical protein
MYGVAHDEIAARAAEIATLHNAGSDVYNWRRAERELEAERDWARECEQAARQLAAVGIDADKSAPSREEIVERAHLLSELRTSGSRRHNWLQAEYELRREHAVRAERADSIAGAEDPDRERGEMQAYLGSMRSYWTKQLWHRVFGPGIDAESSAANPGFRA